MDRHTAHKALIAPLRAAMYDFEASSVREALPACENSTRPATWGQYPC
ncbi:hypothetical protein [Shimia sediminis]|nr:hypothetical protein [Shimia sediminis]